MTDKEIVQALECCCSKKNCEDNCPYFEWKKNTFECIPMSTTDTCDLINRQQKEIDYWKSKAFDGCMEKEKIYKDARVKAIKEFTERVVAEKYYTGNKTGYGTYAVMVDTINKIAEKMIGEGNV